MSTYSGTDGFYNGGYFNGGTVKTDLLVNTVSVNITIDAKGNVTGSASQQGTLFIGNNINTAIGYDISAANAPITGSTSHMTFTLNSGAVHEAVTAYFDSFGHVIENLNVTKDGFTGSNSELEQLSLQPSPPTLPPIISFSQGSLSVNASAGVATYTLSRGPVPIGDTGSTVTVSTQDGTATAGHDYAAISQQVSFAPGATSATVTVPIFLNSADAAAHINPDFSLIISNPINASIGFGTTDTTINESTPSVVLLGPSSQYTVSAAAGSSTINVQNKAGTDTASITTAHNLQFTDQTINSAVLMQTAGLPSAQLVELVDTYIAYFNRAPDAVGLDFWGSSLANGVSFSTIANGFAGSAEATAAYPTTLSNQAFVTAVYTNVLGRNTDASGLSFWVNQLQSGGVTKGNFVLSVVQSVLLQTGTADAQYIANKEAVGAHFALTQGLSDGSWAKAVMAGVNGTAASVTAANALTDGFAVTAGTASSSELVMKIVGIVA